MPTLFRSHIDGKLLRQPVSSHGEMIQEISLRRINRDKDSRKEGIESDKGLRYKPFRFKYKSPDKSYYLEIPFNCAEANKQKIIDTLSEVVKVLDQDISQPRN